MKPERRQVYFEEGDTVYRAAEGADPTEPAKTQTPAPRLICKAVSRRMAQRIAAALNLYIPKNERAAIQREVLRSMPEPRVLQLKEAFKSVMGRKKHDDE